MKRPWVTPKQVKDYSASEKVKARSDAQLAFDIARAEKYVIFYTHNKFDSLEYKNELPSDVMMAVILLADMYAKQSISQKEGAIKSETFDDYSYTLSESDSSMASLNLATLLEDYVIDDKGKVIMKLRKL